MAAKKSKVSDGQVIITAPNFQIVSVPILGSAQYVMNKFPDLTIIDVVRGSYETSCAKGWHSGTPSSVGELIALMHSELSEALEEHRVGHAPDEIYESAGGKPEGIPIELADVVLRIGDFCGRFNIDLADAIERKMVFNKTRPVRHGGKVM